MEMRKIRAEARRISPGGMLKYVYFVILVGLVILLNGCGVTDQGKIIQDSIIEAGEQVNDAGLNNAQWFTCYGASVGSVRRKFGGSEESQATYEKYCAVPTMSFPMGRGS